MLELVAGSWAGLPCLSPQPAPSYERSQWEYCLPRWSPLPRAGSRLSKGLGQPSLGEAWELPTCPAPALLQVNPLIQNSLCCAARLSPGNISMWHYYSLCPSLTVVPWTHAWIKTNPSRPSIFPFASVSPLCRCQEWPEFTQFICSILLTFVLANKTYLH